MCGWIFPSDRDEKPSVTDGDTEARHVEKREGTGTGRCPPALPGRTCAHLPTPTSPPPTELPEGRGSRPRPRWAAARPGSPQPARRVRSESAPGRWRARLSRGPPGAGHAGRARAARKNRRQPEAPAPPRSGRRCADKGRGSRGQQVARVCATPAHGEAAAGDSRLSPAGRLSNPARPSLEK